MARKPTSNADVTSVRKAKSLGGSHSRLTLTRGLIRRHLWVLPVLAMLMLLFAGTWLRSRIEGAIEHQQLTGLEALLNADVTALELWLGSAEADAKALAKDNDVRPTVLELIKLASDSDHPLTPNELLQLPAAKKLAEEIEPWLETQGYTGYLVVDNEPRILASKAPALVGQPSLPGYTEFVKRVFSEGPLVSAPFPSTAAVSDEWGGMSVGVPTMFAAAPVLDDEGKTVAVLGLRIRPDKEFTQILNVARTGESGETYAFNQVGLLLSRSRFEDQLKQIGLQVDQPHSRSVLAVELRDPGVDMTLGHRPALRRSEQPLTRMAAEAVQGKPGIDVLGYRDYRGVPVIGAWTWLPRYGFGVATEIDKAEAYQPVYILRGVFWTLFGLLSAGALGLFGMTLLARRLESKVRDAVIAAGKLGQYTLGGQIGAGGMGTVYRAQHSMLRRPTAVKLLDPSKANEVAIARFEREVQATSQLNHPNTITIYDYGRTPEGIFYYAMELLDGLSLESLVNRYGPQPDGRVLHILLQVCGSLVEAHAAGLIHRDIKPANVMLTCRGGICDFAKLLDFGLVKPLDTRQMTVLTAADSVTGTPLYMPPEAMQDGTVIDVRSDLYSLGGVGYYLLTGRPVFEGNGVLDVIRAHAEKTPVPPSERAGRPICTELEQAILACLAKQPSQRPASCAELSAVLSRCVPLEPWTMQDARRWWLEHKPETKAETASALTAGVHLSSTLALPSKLGE